MTSEDALVRAALADRDRGETSKAVASIAAALRTAPESARLWQTLGLLHRAELDSGEAARCFARAAELAPADARIAHGLARVLLEGGRPAVAAYERVLRLAPSDGDAILGWAAAMLAEGRGREAANALGHLLRQSPNWLAGHEKLADLRWLLGDGGAFVASYREAVRHMPQSVAHWLGLIDRLMRVDDHEGAAAATAQALAACGRSLPLLRAQAALASETGAFDEADRLYAELGSVADRDTAIGQVRHLLRRGRAADAEARARPFLATPDGAHLWPYVATAWRLLGDPRHDWLFDPALVASVDILDESPVARLAEVLRGLHTHAAWPVGQSVRGGTQTDGPLFARIDPEIRELAAVVRQAVASYVAALGPALPGHPVRGQLPRVIRFAGSWSVRLTGAGFHTHHVHPMGWISSAFYVAVPAAAESGPAPAGWLALGQPPAELGLALEPVALVEPRPGRLALFPSILWHGTRPFQGGERMTVAFDIAA